MASTVATASSKVGMPGARREAGRGSPRAGDPAVGEGAFAGLGQRHEGEAAEAECRDERGAAPAVAERMRKYWASRRKAKAQKLEAQD